MPQPPHTKTAPEREGAIAIFPWDDNFNTGLPVVDEQHRKLVELLNRLASQFAFGGDDINLGVIFDELLAYTEYHFDTEEAIWNEYFKNDVHEEEHRKTHALFIEKLRGLIRLQEERSPTEAAEETLDFLVRWLASHILETDRHMAYVVAALQEGKPMEEAKAAAAERMSGFTRKMIDIVLSIYATLTHNTLHLMQELFERQRAEKAVRENREKLYASEMFLRTLVNEMPDAMVLKDQNGNFLLANRAAAEFCGTTPEEMVGKSDADFGATREMDDFSRQNALDIMACGKAEVVMEDARNAVTGKTHHFRSIKKPFKDAEGNNRLLIIAHDMTDMIHAERELTHQRSFLKNVIQTIPDLIWLKDTEGFYLACNPRFENFFGAAESEIIGRTDYDFIGREQADFFREHDRSAMQREKPTVNEEWITFADDGHRELLETSKSPMYDENGELIGVLGIGHDITKIRKAEERIRESELSLRSLFDSLREAVYVQDARGTFLAVNEGAARMYGYSREWFEGKTAEDIAAPERNDMEALAQALKQAMSGQPQTFEFWGLRADGTLFPKEVHLSAGTWFGQQVVFAVALDITERIEHEAHLEHIAHYDALTGLPNRLLLSDRLKQAMAMAQRRKCIAAVVYLDLDGFKTVNDLYGHETGDKLLIAVARHMKQVLREEDTLARLGGDEFVAVLMGLEGFDACTHVLERLLDAVAIPITIDNVRLQVSASLGVTFFPQADEVDADQLIRQGDQAMYIAKQAGKNRYHLFDAEHDRSMRGRHESLEAIRNALLRQEFVLHYQPKADMSSGEVFGAEALLRWKHPKRGLLQPAEFLSVIEGHPLAVDVGEWVLEAAMTQIEAWKALDIRLQVSVNIDGRHLQQGDFFEKLYARLKRHPGVERGDLELEILETSALEDTAYVFETIRACKEIGVGFAIDDFGTGYSSLTYLKNLPVNLLKIDQSFVRDMLDDPDDLAILDGVLGLASAFGREALAEGVESFAHGELLLQMGCRLGQGYAIARPMEAEAFPMWMHSWMPPESWTERKILTRDDMKIVYRLIEHRAWVQNLLGFLQSRHGKQPSLDPHVCRFGHWIDHDGQRRFKGEPVFEQIVLLHEEAHRLAKALVALHAGGDKTQLEEGMIELEVKRDEMLELLKRLLERD